MDNRQQKNSQEKKNHTHKSNHAEHHNHGGQPFKGSLYSLLAILFYYGITGIRLWLSGIYREGR